MIKNANSDFSIETTNLAKIYGKTVALKSLSMKVPKNATVAFLGPNGAGKTTTIKILLGLIRPTEGHAMVFGYDSNKESLSVRQLIGYMPQDPRFYDYMTAREILYFTANLYKKYQTFAQKSKIDEILELVGLENKADRSIKGFSGGERQRLGIAQAQINQPEMLILDEPAANLDPQGRRDILSIIEKLRGHTTVFYSTHILEDVQRVSDQVIILHRGKLVFQENINSMAEAEDQGIFELITRGNHEDAYAKLMKQPWIAGIDRTEQNSMTTWQIEVTDMKLAETHLLRYLLEDGELNVIEVTLRRQNLEDIFMNIISNDKEVDHE